MIAGRRCWLNERFASWNRLFAAGGFDFAFIDTEHSPLGVETVSDLIVENYAGHLKEPSALRVTASVAMHGT